MTYSKTNWVSGQNKYNITDQAGNIIYADVKIDYAGTGGTPISETNLNKIELALEDLNPVLAYFGKFSQMSTSTVSTTSAVMSFSTETNDDFSVINIGTSASRMTIPAALNGKKVRYKFIGTLGTNAYQGTGSMVSLRKNGSDLQTLGSITAGTSAANNFTGTFESVPITVATNDYFDLFATVEGGTSPTTVTCIAFIMEVLG